MSEFLPYGKQAIDVDDLDAVRRVLQGDWLTTGPAVDEFEVALRERVGARHAMACSSGTAALHLAALALGLGEGDRVIVPSMTFLATANAVRYVGAEVVFADVDPNSGLMRLEDVEAAARRADGPVKAVFPVHLNGQTVDMNALSGLARDCGWRVVEDAAHALGSERDLAGRTWRTGDCRGSDMTIFSFHPVKTVTMGEGGAVVTNDDVLADRVQVFRNHGMVREPGRFVDREAAFDPRGAANPWYYELQMLGFNYRASDIHCALGTSQLRKLDGFLRRRRELVDIYDQAIASLAPQVVPVSRVGAERPGWHLYAVLVDFAACDTHRAAVMHALRERGIGTQVHYVPVHRQPYYRHRYGDIPLPGAEYYGARELSLPLYPAMRDDDVHRVVETLREILGDGA